MTSSRSGGYFAEGALKEDVEVFRYRVHVWVAELPENVARTVILECDFASGAFPQQDAKRRVEADRWLTARHFGGGQGIPAIILKGLAVLTPDLQQDSVIADFGNQ